MEKKTAERFFEDESKRQFTNSNNGLASDPDSICRIPYILRPKVYKVMHEYSNQQLNADEQK